MHGVEAAGLKEIFEITGVWRFFSVSVHGKKTSSNILNFLSHNLTSRQRIDQGVEGNFGGCMPAFAETVGENTRCLQFTYLR